MPFKKVRPKNVCGGDYDLYLLYLPTVEKKRDVTNMIHLCDTILRWPGIAAEMHVPITYLTVILHHNSTEYEGFSNPRTEMALDPPARSSISRSIHDLIFVLCTVRHSAWGTPKPTKKGMHMGIHKGQLI